MGHLKRKSSCFLLLLTLNASAAWATAPAPVILRPQETRTPLTEQQQTALNTALANVVGIGAPDEIQQLITQGGNPNGLDNRGIPLISLASIRRDGNALSAMQALLAGGADINIRDQYQQTPLIYATRSGLPASVQFLCERGASTQLADRSGNTPQAYAQAAGRADLVEALKTSRNQTLPQPAAPAPASPPAPAADTPTAVAPAATTISAGAAPEATASIPETKPDTKPAETPSTDRLQLLQGIRSLSFHACATEYWRYCQRVNQQTDLKTAPKIEANIEEINTASEADTLRQQYGAQDNYVMQIIGQSRDRIARQFGALPNNAQRKEQGMGTRTDMEKRCGNIADDWQFTRIPQGKKSGDNGSTPAPGVRMLKEEGTTNRTITAPPIPLQSGPAKPIPQNGGSP